jgi:A/G-specific adenine glycosylase
VVEDYGGTLPSDPGELRRLPGVGPYTAAAVASIGFGFPVPAIDTNVARVVRRAVLGRDDATRAEVETTAGRWLDHRDPGGWNQAVMDLGREICRPIPRCDVCPLARSCAFRRTGAPLAPVHRRQPAFEGSSRQLRGVIVRVLRDRGSATVGALSVAAGRSAEEVARAVVRLAADGVVRAGPAAVAGSPRGRVRL